MTAANRPRWRHVYDDLRTQIERGDLAPGQRIPAELELAERYGFSRPTIRTALGHLQQDALITAGAGSLGRTVRSRFSIFFNASDFERGAYTDDPAQAVDQWKADVEQQGWTPRQVVTVTWMAAPSDIAEMLDVSEGTMLARRRRLRMVSRPPQDSEMPVMLADTWAPEDVAVRTVTGEDGQEFAPFLVERDVVVTGGIFRAIGCEQREFEDRIVPRMPTPDEVELLDLQPGSPVGQHARIGIDHSGRRVRVLVSTWVGERQVLRYRLPASPS
ncbi:GntR family transcriptional regulator [Prauserella isguenensis]|uniref:GntR family transcriptional regulator n=1 Tax=Prauserella isguenensis TaxID=1470180 RepID=A0A839SA76_9PSEU|nr:GntR family transcriptional regulator [Prauserella isguenensis]MBB3053517.1 GntR family transcriptional regulator [Prauserella isguenensis]